MRDLPALWYKPCVRSMTGYGRGKSEVEGLAVTVEVRSVNHRFLDLKLRGASLEPKQEEALRKRVAEHVVRGSVSVSVRIDKLSAQGGLQIDSAAAARAHSELSALAQSLGVDSDISLSLILGQPGVMVPATSSVAETAEQVAAFGACTLEAADQALSELVSMRDAEGASLLTDVRSRLAGLGALASELRASAEEGPAAAQTRLEERIAKLLKNSKVEVDDARLAQEVAILADRLDVTEELVRLASHFEQLALLVAAPEPVGRRLDFLVQELGREFNTVTSKSQSANVARLVVDAKSELEKIREQVQNVE
ncbi:MAG: YicC family protein [Myxococcales bacterium]|nr:YicC family protein [Myxococcales bacterium]